MIKTNASDGTMKMAAQTIRSRGKNIHDNTPIAIMGRSANRLKIIKRRAFRMLATKLIRLIPNNTIKVKANMEKKLSFGNIFQANTLNANNMRKTAIET